MTPALRDPFRTADLEARVVALREERDRLAGELQEAQSELRILLALKGRTAAEPPWSWGRFFLGFCILPGGLVLLVAGLALRLLLMG
jgi:hypothetical protein